MEEMLKIMYRNYVDEYDRENSKTCNAMSEVADVIFDKVESLEKILNKELYNELYDFLYDGIADVQEMAFVAGFAQCAKMLSNGKIDFFPNN